MLQWFRARARVPGLVVLVSLAGLGGVSAHGAECHDQECVRIVPHDHASHFVRSGTTAAASTPLHCVLCHFTRSLRPSTEPVHHLSRPISDVVRLPAEVREARSLVHAAQPPLRSPPLA